MVARYRVPGISRARLEGLAGNKILPGEGSKGRHHESSRDAGLFRLGKLDGLRIVPRIFRSRKPVRLFAVVDRLGQVVVSRELRLSHLAFGQSYGVHRDDLQCATRTDGRTEVSRRKLREFFRDLESYSCLCRPSGFRDTSGVG